MENITLSNLEKRKDFFEETMNLIETSFHYTNHHKFSIDFAPLINSTNSSNSFILIDNQKQQLIGHVGILKKTMTLNRLHFPICLIGGVAIKDEYRGRGFFQRLLKEIEMREKEKNTFFLLWSDLINFYEKFHFYLAIGVHEFCKKDKEQTSFTKVPLKNLSQQDISQVRNLYREFIENKFITILRDDNSWRIIEEITSSDFYIRRNKNEQITDYFFANKGADLKDTVHEIASASFDNRLLSDIPFPYIWLPEQFHYNIDTDHQKNLKYLGLMKIGSHKLFNQFIDNYSEGSIVLKEIDQNNISFIFDGNHYQDSIKNFLPQIFGPNPAHEFKHFHKPFFISGLDSI